MYLYQIFFVLFLVNLFWLTKSAACVNTTSQLLCVKLLSAGGFALYMVEQGIPFFRLSDQLTPDLIGSSLKMSIQYMILHVKEIISFHCQTPQVYLAPMWDPLHVWDLRS